MTGDYHKTPTSFVYNIISYNLDCQNLFLSTSLLTQLAYQCDRIKLTIIIYYCIGRDINNNLAILNYSRLSNVATMTKCTVLLCMPIVLYKD